ncbi:MAG: ATP-binding protein [Candidatus Obscuribacter sp.]|nr:PAS domain S-box protein [Candidatus Melainabacteria bacterium]MDX1990656.1 ATP-binding protein [Candidatus Obscuribacter sp.]
MKLRFSQQVLLLISLPLLFQVAFIGLLTANLIELRNSYQKESAIADVMISFNNFLSQIVTCAGAQALFQISKDAKNRQSFEQSLIAMRAEQKTLRNMLMPLERVRSEATELDGLFTSLDDSFQKGMRALDTQDQVDATVAYIQARRTTVKVENLARRLRLKLNEQRQIFAERQAQTSTRTYILVGAGFVFNILLALLLFLYFQRRTSRRFALLTENITALGLERPLLNALAGVDELAQLDRTLHKVSESLKEARIKEQAILTNAADFICSIDAGLRLTAINPAVEAVFAVSQDELLGRNINSLVPAKKAQFVLERFKQIAQDRAGSFELAIVNHDGREVELSWNVIWSEPLQSYFCVAHDITERKKLERLKQEFVAMLSHDMRAPLTSLQLTLNVLSSTADQLNEKSAQRVARAEASVKVLVDMISELLEMEKLQSDVFVLECQTCSLNSLVEEALSLVEESGKAKQLSLRKALEPIEVSCDGERIVRVLTNLLFNAIKFSPQGGQIAVITRRSGEFVTVEVSDQGPGIPENMQELVFERFRQVDSAEGRGASASGTGLGLAICKAIIAAHRGEIGVRSQLGKGSVFWFKIPV